jgi:hypothetical protein
MVVQSLARNSLFIFQPNLKVSLLQKEWRSVLATKLRIIIKRQSGRRSHLQALPQGAYITRPTPGVFFPPVVVALKCKPSDLSLFVWFIFSGCRR